MGGLKTIATVATVAFVTTGSSLSAANGKEQQKLDGAAFLETFDDGLKGWVKSEVEQYTGAFFLSLSLSLYCTIRIIQSCIFLFQLCTAARCQPPCLVSVEFNRISRMR